jgi:ferredoxin-NADP reductase
MPEFIDLAGVSGALYRFHRISDVDELPAIAGNFVYVRGAPGKMTVVCAGTGETLSTARKRWSEAVAAHGVEAVYVRRNVSRRSRQTEHQDIVAQLHPVMDAGEAFGD